jgi:predicted ABC-type ATPase
MRIGKEKRMLHALRVMSSTICIIGGCNGAGKSTLARELLPRLGIARFLNADLIAKGLSPVNPALAAFAAGRRLLEEASGLIEAGSSFAIESTLSGKTYVKLLREAKERGYRLVLHYIVIGSATQAVERVRLRVLTGGHNVPEDDIRRRFERSVRHFLEDYLPLADEWGLWDNAHVPARQIADNRFAYPPPSSRHDHQHQPPGVTSNADPLRCHRSCSKPAAWPRRRCSTCMSAWASR